VSNVTNMYLMLAAPYFNQDISPWVTSSVANMQQMFYGNTVFNQNLSSWDVDGVIDCLEFSQGASSWTLPQPNFTNCDPN